MYLPANGVRALRALGLEGAVTARAAEIPAAAGPPRACWPRSTWATCGDLGPCLALPQADLHQVLRENVPVRLGHTIRSLERLDGPVQVTFNDGSSGEFDLVVGADGLRSSVRRLTVDDRPPAPVGQHSWRFLAACPPEVTTWTVMLGRGTSFLTVPVGGGLVYCYADISATDKPDGESGGCASGSPALPHQSHSCWTYSRTPPGSMSHRSSRSPAHAGVAARCCWSATPPTACRPTPAEGAAPRSRTPWC